LWHAHTGWLFSAAGRAVQSRDAKDLLRDRGMRVIAKLFLPLVLFSLAAPAVAGWPLIGGWYGFFAGLFWAAPFGSSCSNTSHSRSTRFATCGAAVVSHPATSHGTCGGSPGAPSASPGTTTITRSPPQPSTAPVHRRSTPGGWLIWLLERAGLAWNVIRIPPGKQARKLAGSRETDPTMTPLRV
jgi:stearoyl-CoA desaturase (delta-9 desaturase)